MGMTALTMSDEYLAGEEAYHAGQSPDHNPYIGTPNAHLWMCGFRNAEQDAQIICDE